MRFRELATSASVLALGFALSSAPPAAAQSESEDIDGQAESAERGTPPAVEEITVTGTYIKRTDPKGPQAVQVIDAAQIEDLGVQAPIDIIKNLSINTGSEFQSDAFQSGGTYGTANVNLRGLGLGTTLVLVDGRRQVISGTTANDGSSFVDINTIPLGLVERVEVLKEGAAATYGSDAVAGVVNFITRKDFEGFELRTGYNTTTSGGQRNQDLSALWGWGNDKTHLTLFASGSDLNQLNSSERKFTRSARDANGTLITTRGNSTLGKGAFLPLTDAVPTPLVDPSFTAAVNAARAAGFINGDTPVTDPDCLADGGAPNPGPAPILGRCSFEFVDNFNLQEHEKRANYALQLRHDFSENLSASFKWNFAYNKQDDIGLSPSFPLLTFPRVPENNPGNIFGTTAVFFGRPLAEARTSERGFYYSKASNYEAGLNGAVGDWEWDLHYTFQKQRRYANVPDTIFDRFQAALNGLGGPNCDSSNTALAGSAADGCFFFNPFASADLNPTGTGIGGLPLGNREDVIDFFTGRIKTDTDTELQVIDFVMSGDLFDLPAGPVGVAFGYQYRRDSYQLRSNGGTGMEPDFNRFIFLTAPPEFDKVRSTTALFVESAVPLTDRLEAQLALRFEEYNGAIGSSVDPKLALRWQATDWLALRGSFSTTFRAPTLSQIASFRTSQDPIRDGNPGNVDDDRPFGFVAVTTRGNNQLAPEEADVYNLGLILEPFEGLDLTLDYYRIDFSDVIVQETAQTLVDNESVLNLTNGVPFASTNGGPTGIDQRLDCNNPGFQPLLGADGNPVIQRTPDCNISRINANFRNAPSIITDGIDLALNYSRDVGAFGTMAFNLNVSHLIQYDIRGQGFCPLRGGSQPESCKAAGNINTRTFSRALPKWRGNATMSFYSGAHAASLTFRYISSYDDDNNENNKISQHGTIDLAYSYELPFRRFDTRLQVGVIDVLNTDPPFATTDFNYDTRTHSPFGRRVFANIRTRF